MKISKITTEQNNEAKLKWLISKYWTQILMITHTLLEKTSL